MKIYLCYRRSHLYGGIFENGATEDRDELFDADTDAIVLVRRVNTHFARPDQIYLERGNKHEIPAFAMRSPKLHGSGGGCDYQAWLEIIVAPTLADAPSQDTSK